MKRSKLEILFQFYTSYLEYLDKHRIQGRIHSTAILIVSFGASLSLIFISLKVNINDIINLIK